MLDICNIKSAVGIVTIRNKETGKIILDRKHNAMHFGNLTVALASAFVGDDNHFLNTMGFGNGATAITPDGKVFYRNKNVSNVYDPTASLYNQTYQKTLSNLASVAVSEGNSISITSSESGYTDINIICTLDYGEPTGQDMEAVGEDPNAPFIFDEIGMKTDSGLMVSHVIFHPLQKAANRAMEVEYTIRLQMS